MSISRADLEEILQRHREAQKIEVKKPIRERISSDVQEFLLHGGKINILGTGERACVDAHIRYGYGKFSTDFSSVNAKRKPKER